MASMGIRVSSCRCSGETCSVLRRCQRLRGTCLWYTVSTYCVLPEFVIVNGKYKGGVGGTVDESHQVFDSLLGVREDLLEHPWCAVPSGR